MAAKEERKSKILFEGYAFKQGSGVGLFGRTNWKKRYFVLSSAGFHYFSEKGGALIESYPRTGIGKFHAVEDKKNKKAFFLEIEVWNADKGNRSLKMYTETAEERQKWLDAFQRLIAEPEPSYGPSPSSGKGPFKGVSVKKQNPATLQQCEQKKQQANKLFTEGKLSEAVAIYTSIIDTLSSDSKEPVTSNVAPENEVINLVAICLNNRAQCKLKTEDYSGVVEDTTMCLSVQPDNIKALVRRAQAYEATGEFLKAINDCEMIIHINPEAEEANTMLDRLMEKKSQQKTVHAFKKEQLNEWNNTKEAANAAFTSGKYDVAIKKYTEIINEIDAGPHGEALESEAAEKSKIDGLLIASRNNRAASYLQAKNFSAALDDTTWVLLHEPDNYKALCRQAEAAEGLNKHVLVVESGEKALKIEQNAELQEKISKAKKALESDKTNQTKEETPKTSDTNRAVRGDGAGKGKEGKDGPTANSNSGAPGAYHGFSSVQLKEAESHKTDGNKKFSSGQHYDAIQSYTKAISIFNPNSKKGGGTIASEIDVIEVIAASYNNRALCYKAMGDYSQMYADADLCLKIQPQNAKALARRAQAAEELGMIKQAIEDCRAALEITEIEECRVRLRRLDVENKHAKKIVEDQRKEKEERNNKPAATLNTKAELESEKNKGNEFFKKGLLGDAIESYTRVIDSPLCKDASGDQDLHVLVANCYNNRAACSLSLEKYFDVIEDCSTVLKMQPQNVKALLRRAKASEAIRMNERAIADYRAVLSIDSSITEAQEGLAKLQK